MSAWQADAHGTVFYSEHFSNASKHSRFANSYELKFPNFDCEKLAKSFT
jgi:hypothetical protein